MRYLTTLALACLIATPASALDCSRLDTVRRAVAQYEGQVRLMGGTQEGGCAQYGDFSEDLCGREEKLDGWTATFKADLELQHRKLQQLERQCAGSGY